MTSVTNDIKVSVVIPTKNAGFLFKEVLNSVMNQELNWPFEVLVIDSGSIDDTVKIVNSFPSIRLIEISTSEFGHGRTRNFAIENTTGQYIAMLTQDALPENKYWLAELVSSIEQSDKIAGVFGRHISYLNASPFTRNELEQHFFGFLSKPIVRLDDPLRYKNDEGYRQFLYFFSDNNSLIRRSVWQNIPYPEVDFAEDQAWARQIIEAGYSKAYAHNAVVRHSHNYGLFERLQRSFDESYALFEMFNYKNNIGFKLTLKNFLAVTLRDFRFAIKSKMYLSNVRDLVLMPFDNLMRFTGHYLGMHGKNIPLILRKRLSRDIRLMMVSENSKK